VGIYIHIPFCRQACRYCDFFFSVSLHYADEFVDRLVQEIELKGRSHTGDPMNTLYLGGGTPSLLSRKNLNKILESVHRHFTFRQDAEVTIECNPDDLDALFTDYLITSGFNRLSIGIQSFQEKDLLLMRRSHGAEQGVQSIEYAASAGFENITIDLIYGLPDQSDREWQENLSKAIALPISHLSAYHLTFEPGTVFEHWRKKGRIIPVHEEKSLHQFKVLREQMILAGFDHYEISNFALQGKMSEHNLIYWSGLPYLGIGPSAHSFEGSKRKWNIASLKKYMEGISLGKDISEYEHLSPQESYHDYLITSLRTKWGVDPVHIEHHFGNQFRKKFELNSKKFLKQGTMWKPEENIAIHPDHWLITDHILRELFMD